MSRGGSRTAATSTMKHFVTIVSDWKPDNYYHKEFYHSLSFLETAKLILKEHNLKILSLFRLRTACKVSHFEQNTVRTQSSTFIRTRSSVVFQMIEVKTGILRDLRGVFLWYRLIYSYIRNKKFSVSKFQHFWEVGQVTGNRSKYLLSPNIIFR